MPLYSALPEKLKAADIVIAAPQDASSRISDAYPDLSVLLIERGSDNYGDPTVVHPALYVLHMMPTSPKMQFHKARSSAALDNRETVTPVGKVLGGGSSVNMLMYSRPQRSDFESWQASGWSPEEMLKQMKKIENFHGKGSDEQHGHDGPIHVSSGTHGSSRLENAFMVSLQEAGWEEITDLADLDTNDGAQRALKYISPDGRRQDTAHCYLHPRLRDEKHPNLHVLVETEILKVTFDEKKHANGVVVKCTGSSGYRTIGARKMVIVSSGALGTPAILERSGLGDPNILEAAGIEPVVDLPGVGSGYEDHQLCVSPYQSNLVAEETLDGFVNGGFAIPDLIESDSKMLGWNGMQVSGKLRPNAADVEALGPEFQTNWDEEFATCPNKPMTGITLIAGNSEDPTKVPRGQYYTIGMSNYYPLSRGHIHVTGPGLNDALDFDTGFFTDEHDIDIKRSRWAYKKQREIARRMSVYRGELAVFHPKFPASSKAVCVTLSEPPVDVKDIEYTAEDDATIDEWLRHNIATAWHPLGTCKMLSREQGGVVDTDLSVYGVTGLSIADVSIVPRNVGAHTNNIAMVIGEKAAEIFIERLGLASNSTSPAK
ncbi:alcohol oxidase-like protein [Xylariaceae sp. FL1272]|nr:alcohol oxidase-like protein [Xylariaceae sp. FL1272]